MTTAAENPRRRLTRYVSEEERDELSDKAHKAFARGEEDEACSYLAQLPLIPSLAKFALEEKGLEYCEKYFNLYEIEGEIDAILQEIGKK